MIPVRPSGRPYAISLPPFRLREMVIGARAAGFGSSRLRRQEPKRDRL
jgi:hypothetical protein